MNAWFLWNVDHWYLEVLAIFSGLIFYNREQYAFDFQNCIFVFLLLVVAILWNTKLGLGSIYMVHLPFLFILGLKEEFRGLMLKWWTILYAVILVVSLVGWGFSWTGLIPDFGMIVHPSHENYSYTNYYVCIRGLFYDIRFNSIFLEPGHTAMIAAFTIVANRFDLKNKWVLCILICTLFTFSLAGYVLLTLGFMLIRLLQSSIQQLVKKMLPFVISMVSVYYIGISYNHGDNLFNELILERLAVDDEKGIVGNNRTSETTDATFDYFLQSTDLLTGMSINKYRSYCETREISGAGYKLYLMQKGVLGTLLVFFFYYSLYKKSDDRKIGLIMFLIYFVAFWQRAYPFWDVWLFLFPMISRNNENYITVE